MPLTNASIRREAARRQRTLRGRVGEDVARLRTDAGVSRAILADAVGVHRSHIDRIEAGLAHPSLDLLVAIGVALGADLGVRYFAGAGPRLHDRFQAPMVESFIRALASRWSVQAEVAVAEPARGVIDLVLTDRVSDTIIAAEVQSELRRLDQQLRWASEKADGLRIRLRRAPNASTDAAVSRLLILRSTTATRELARLYEATLTTAYPARATDAVAALTSQSAPWPGAAIVWMDLERGQATVLPGAPRGVRLGR